MIRRIIKSIVGEEKRRAVRRAVGAVQGSYVKTFQSFDEMDLRRALADVGIVEGDTVLVHSNFPPNSGFTGNPASMVNALVSAVGKEGNLLMVSIPFRGSAADHLEKERIFDVSRAISMMGLVSEVFRRREGAVRSLHPTHPVVALGPDAEHIVDGHSLTDYPCGTGSPFEKLLEKNGKILFVDVSIGAMTFFHYLEHRFRDKLPEPVYEDKLYLATVRDACGDLQTVTTFAFKRSLDRDTGMLERELDRNNAISRGKVGRTTLLLVDCAEVVRAMKCLLDKGEIPVRRQSGN